MTWIELSERQKIALNKKFSLELRKGETYRYESKTGEITREDENGTLYGFKPAWEICCYIEDKYM